MIHVKPWIFLLTLIFSGFSTPSLAQNPPYHLLLISSEKGEPYQSVIQAMFSRLGEQGYSDMKKLTTTSYSLDHYPGRARSILRKEANHRFDLVVVMGTIGTIALKDLIWDHPRYPNVLFSTVTDPVGIGVIENFSSPPQHNFTGVAFLVPVKERFLFIRRVMPKARIFGLIYSDMPQSHSYNQWVRNLVIHDPDFKDYKILFREVPFAKSKGGKIRMGDESIRFIKELNHQVDLFLSPQDQMALQPFFPKNVYKYGTKPLVGVGYHDVMERRGATMAIFPTPRKLGKQTADMVLKFLNGANPREVIPEETREYSISFDMDKVRQFGLTIPEDLLKKAGNNITGD